MLQNIPLVNYSLDDTFVKDYKRITNIFTRIVVSKGLSEDRYNILENYIIQNGDTPETIAYSKYKNTSWWWVVLVTNPRITDQSDWPMSDSELQYYLDINYGESQYDRLNPTVDSNLPFINSKTKNIVDHHSIDPIIDTNFKTIGQSYWEKNELNKRISIISPQHVSEFVNEYVNALDNHILIKQINASRRKI